MPVALAGVVVTEYIRGIDVAIISSSTDTEATAAVNVSRMTSATSSLQPQLYRGPRRSHSSAAWLAGDRRPT
eukprot:CAMPEP_0182928054 /NCGR_PEP_ID=MMETSP0105_2-20130417/15035_1 /TAXON_ID=81532 ORGANISM="Acanthoeca-like sp., Strain 10tr" /NCGR_SAMPLE_ID=MMETSP0105_2 /ASSEMBLY_ACC=CAM_ASM_000205 /LENGTH=71 /DNA_ID=CAMNT_0025066043 /DNA_START=659 /DNA_END=871 /DNA_ORIENTATION=-